MIDSNALDSAEKETSVNSKINFKIPILWAKTKNRNNHTTYLNTAVFQRRNSNVDNMVINGLAEISVSKLDQI